MLQEADSARCQQLVCLLFMLGGQHHSRNKDTLDKAARRKKVGWGVVRKMFAEDIFHAHLPSSRSSQLCHPHLKWTHLCSVCQSFEIPAILSFYASPNFYKDDHDH